MRHPLMGEAVVVSFLDAADGWKKKDLLVGKDGVRGQVVVIDVTSEPIRTLEDAARHGEWLIWQMERPMPASHG